MEWIEVTGRTIEDAKELALDRLGVVEAELEYEIVEEPKAGLFGRIGRTEARIRARVKPLSREKPGERRRRRSQKGRGRREPANGAPAPGARGAGAIATADDEDDDDDDGVGPRPTASGQNRRRRRRRGRGGDSSNTTGASGTDGVAAGTSVIVQEESVVDDVPIEEQASAAEHFTTGLIEAFDLGARVHTEVRDEAVHIDIAGDGLGLLVGPRGSTLAALEEIVRAVVQRSTGGHSARVHVDVGGYRQRRREALAEFTRRLAAEVKNEGVERALEPMTPPDRKVVHDTVAEIDGVTTTSQGEEPRRRVVIRPA